MNDQRGFTLVEMVMAIVLIGIVGGMVAVFMRAPIEGYFDTARRTDMSAAADSALRRIAFEVRGALPNSLRGAADGSNQCFEFLPMAGGGRYQSDTDAVGGDPLDFGAADTSFDVLAGSLPAAFTDAMRHIVIYNLGIPGADAYAGDNRAQINGATSTFQAGCPGGGNRCTIAFASKLFPLASDVSRFQIIEDRAVVYSCSGGAILRSTRAIAAAQMATCPTTGDILVDHVDCAGSRFEYDRAATIEYGLLSMTLVLTQAGESLSLSHQVEVANVP